MKIEFTKEDIKQIRRITRQEISRFLNKSCIDLNTKVQEDDTKEIMGGYNGR